MFADLPVRFHGRTAVRRNAEIRGPPHATVRVSLFRGCGLSTLEAPRRKGTEMRHKRSPRTSIRSPRRLRGIWRRERRQRPVAYRLALIGVAALGLSAALVAMDLSVIAQLVAGLALLPLSLATFFRLLPPPPWTDEGNDGRGGGQDTDSDGPWPPDEPALKFDWDTFERQFREFVETGASRPVR